MDSVGKKVTFVAAIVLSVLAFTGCQTMAGWFGLATQQYVDEKLVEVQAQVDEYAATADKLEDLIGSVEEAVQTTEELKQLAGVLEERLVNLPEETIKQLVEILSTHLDSR